MSAIKSGTDWFVRPTGLHPAALTLSSLLGLGAAICLRLAFFRRTRPQTHPRPEPAQSS